MRIFLLLVFVFSTIQSQAQNEFSLKQAVQYAVEHSDQLHLDQLEVENAHAQITEYKAIGIPTVTAGVDYQYYVKVPSQPTQDFLTPAIYGVLDEEGLAEPYTGEAETFEFSFFQRNNLTAKVEASSLLFDGSYLTGLKAAKIFKDLQRKALDVTEQEIRAAVTKAYINILILEENQKILEKDIVSLEKTLYETNEFYENGFVEKLDVTRVALSKETLETELLKIESFIQLAKNLLKFQMNYPHKKEIALTEDLQYLVDYLKASDHELDPDLDFSARAEIDQINTALELNQLNVERIKKTNWPNLFAFANYSQSLQRDDLFDSSLSGLIPSSALGLSINFPIYNGGKRTGQLQQAKISTEKVEIQMDQFNRASTLQLSNAQIQFRNAKSSLLNRERLLELNQEVYDTSKIKYEEGVGSSVELTQAESLLYRAQSNYISALYELLNAKIDIDIASGRL